MSHPTKRFWLLPLVPLTITLLTGLAQGASLTLLYGGAGIYPQQATANSERYFRCSVQLGTSDVLVSLRITQGVSGQTQIFPKPNGNWGDPSDGVVRYALASDTTAYTAGPYAGRDIFGNPHAPGEVIGHVSNSGDVSIPFTITAVVVNGTTVTTLTQSSTYNTNGDNDDILEWFSGDALGVDPLGVGNSFNNLSSDNGSGSDIYRFEVEYHILNNNLNLLPRWGTDSYPPGPQANYADFDNGEANAVSRMDRPWDYWTYFPNENYGSNNSRTNPRFDDFTDQTGYTINYQFPEVALIIDGDLSRPHYMQRENPSNTDAKSAQGIRYFYDLLPTDYASFMDNVFLFPYDPPGPDPVDNYPSGIKGRPVSNNYVSLSPGGHTYEFICSDDFSPPNGNSAWLQVGQPGQAEYNDYLKPIIGSGGQMQLDQVQMRFDDSNGASGGFGYPYNSQDTTQYPDVNPVLTAQPYFPRGGIMPSYSGAALSVNPPGAAPDPFAPEVGAGPNPPLRVTNDDTILPNFVNIRPNTDPVAPFRGGKWTTSSTYTLRINYWQSNNVPPAYVRVLIRKNDNGNSPGAWQGFTMEQADSTDNDYTNGAVYQLQITPNQLPGGGGPGDYNYYFVASDGIRVCDFPVRPAADSYNGNIKDPGGIGVPVVSDGSNSYYSFRVNNPPVLSAQAVTPPSANVGTDFQFAVTYTDLDGQMLNPNHQGDRPFETSIYLDLFGSPLGQAHVVSVQSQTGITYNTQGGSGYSVNELVGDTIEMQSGSAVGKSYSIIGNTATTITLAAGTQVITDGVAAGDNFRIADWFHGTMSPADQTDLDYADGKLYTFNTATHMTLSAGTHRYYFVFRDDWGSWLYPDDPNVKVEGEQVRYPFTGSFQGPTVTPNTAPVLTDYRFTPHAMSGSDGTTATGFVFSVTYTDAQNNPPAAIRLGIDGTADAPAIVLDMTSKGGVYSNGVEYDTAPVRLAEGTHIFRAQASDGSLRFPAATASGWPFSGPPDPNNPGSNLDHVAGPTVAANTPPTLSFLSNDNGSDPTNPPGLDPNSGRANTTFTYTVVYTDVDRYAGVAGNPPSYVKVFIDDVGHDMTKVDPNDNDYTDGATYQFTITNLSQGLHTYYFQASDGLDLARLPALSANPSSFSGPLVIEPPNPPLSVQAVDTPNDNGGSITITWNASPDDGGGANDVTEYRVYRRLDSSTAGYVNPPVGTVPATGAFAYQFIDNTAVTGTEYDYIVRAYNGLDESKDSTPEAGPVKAIDNIPPQPPSGVTVTDPGIGGTLDVAWNKSPDDGGGANDVKEYHVYRATSATGFGGTPTAVVPAGTTTYQDTTVTDGVQYWYMVRAFDGSNESLDSNVAGPTVATDQQPPIIANLSPADRAVDVPVDTAISFTAADSGTGVDINTLVVTVDGTTIANSDLNITGTPAKYTVTYQPSTPFSFRDVVTVSVTVSDLGGKQAQTTWKFTITGPPTYTISGTVANSKGVGKAGVVVSAGALTATTDAQGNYTITGLVDGTYTVTPVLRHYSFTPETSTVTIPGSATGIDFTVAAGFDIAGRIIDAKSHGVQGVSVTDGIHTAISDSDGYWRIMDDAAGTYTVVPSLPGYVFTPPSLQVQTGPNQVSQGLRFTAALQTFSVSGSITDVNGNPLGNIAVVATGGNNQSLEDVSNASGAYLISGLLPGQWTIAPRKANYQFKPQSTALNVAADVTNVNFVAVPIYSLTLSAGLSFTAVPVYPEDTNPGPAFGGTAQVSIFRWDPTATPAKYLATTGNATSVPDQLQLQPGRGYWVHEPNLTVANIGGTPVNESQSFGLLLYDGWNMMGNPYDAALPWANVGVVAGGAVRDFAYIYDASTGSYQLVTDTPGVGLLSSVPKNAGMWMRSSGQQAVTISPLSTTAEARTKKWVRAPGEFVIPIYAQAGNRMDTSATAGVLNYAQSHPEAYQIENPPAVKPFVDVYFPTQDGQRLTCDIRGQATADMSYNFTVNTDMANTSVKVSLPDLSQVPADKSITLVDLATGQRIYARTTSVYTYNSGQGGARQFRLEIGPAAASTLVISTAAAQSVGDRVALSYTLSEAANVDVTVMNISGRVVRALSSGQPATAGINTTTWDLRNSTGSRVPSGCYLVRIEAATADGQKVSTVTSVSVNR